MECFEHGKETIGLCTWCGKAICPNCIGKREGNKRYCHNCTSKLSEVQSEDVIRRRVAEHYEEKAKEAEQPELKVEPIAPKKTAFPYGPAKRVDPRHFELDEFDESLHLKTIKHTRPTIVSTKPSVQPASSSAKTALNMFATQAKQSTPIERPKPEIKPAQTSTSQASSSARSALSMLAAQAQETKKKAEEKKE